MSGTIRELGTLSLGAIVPGMAVAQASAALAVEAALGEIQAKLAGLLNVQAALLFPPLPTAALTGALQVVQALQLDLAIAAPSLQITGIASLIIELQAQILALQASLDLVLSFDLGAAGIVAYEYEGTTDTLGSSLSSVTSGGLPGGTGSDPCFALILATSVPSTWAALSKVLLTG